MWDYLNLLPPIIVGQVILTFLDLKALVQLERALADPSSTIIFRALLKFTPKLENTIVLPKQKELLQWLYDRECKITKANLCLHKITTTLNLECIDEIKLCIEGEVDSNMLDLISAIHYEKIVELFIECGNQDVEIMEELFSLLKNLQIIETHCETDEWLSNAFYNLHEDNNCIHTIKLHRNWNITDDDINTIVECCPNLLTLRVISEQITYISLLTLSEHKLPLKDLYFIAWIPIPNIEIAFRCSYALSCISGTTTKTHTEVVDVNTYSFGLSYMTKLRDLTILSNYDHILLPILTQYTLTLDCLYLYSASSATMEQIINFIKSCKQILSLKFDMTGNSILFNDNLIDKIAPYCCNLLIISFEKTTTTTITDNSLISLGRYCHKLYHCDFSKCLEITQFGLNFILQCCNILNTIKLPLTFKIQEKILLSICTRKYRITQTNDCNIIEFKSKYTSW